MTKRSSVYAVIESHDNTNRKSQLFDLFLVTFILLNVIAVIIETVQPIRLTYAVWFDRLEIFAVSLFSLEYLTRVWVCTENKCYKSPVSGRLRYMISPLALIDLLAILPFYLMLLGVDLRVIRIFRIARILRLAKLARYSNALNMLARVIYQKKTELTITIVFMLMLLIVSASLMYFAEHDTQPEAFSSIPAAMWWGIATLTTVGYGDIYPITTLGRMIGSFIAMLGIGMFALPAGILGSGFVEELSNEKGQSITQCPHCGGNISKNNNSNKT